MRSELSDTDECDPPTQEITDDATVAGASATLQFHHLQATLAMLAPLRTTYLSAAADSLRALPLDARRAVLPHVLREHPALASEPRVRVLADEVWLDTDEATAGPDMVRWLARFAGVQATSADDALGRLELALVSLASGVADLARARGDLVTQLATRGARSPTGVVPDETADVLSWTLAHGADDVAHAREVTTALADLVVHAMTVPHAARDAALALMDAPYLDADLAWWARPIAGVGRWIGSVASRGSRTARELRFDAAFASAYLARAQDEA